MVDFGLRNSRSNSRSSSVSPRSLAETLRSCRALAIILRTSTMNRPAWRAIWGSRSGPKTSSPTTAITASSPTPMPNTLAPHLWGAAVLAPVIVPRRGVYENAPPSVERVEPRDEALATTQDPVPPSLLSRVRLDRWLPGEHRVDRLLWSIGDDGDDVLTRTPQHARWRPGVDPHRAAAHVALLVVAELIGIQASALLEHRHRHQAVGVTELHRVTVPASLVQPHPVTETRRAVPTLLAQLVHVCSAGVGGRATRGLGGGVRDPAHEMGAALWCLDRDLDERRRVHHRARGFVQLAA